MANALASNIDTMNWYFRIDLCNVLSVLRSVNRGSRTNRGEPHKLIPDDSMPCHRLQCMTQTAACMLRFLKARYRIKEL